MVHYISQAKAHWRRGRAAAALKKRLRPPGMHRRAAVQRGEAAENAPAGGGSFTAEGV
jgi:hypothetical protein